LVLSGQVRTGRSLPATDGLRGSVSKGRQIRPPTLPDNRVTGLYLDHSGRIWTTGWKGISFWNGTRFVAHTAVNAVVSESEVISCTEDRDGNLWIASSSGLVRARGKEVASMDRGTGLSGNYAEDIFEDREGNLLVGTRGGLRAQIPCGSIWST
jgi:ligand-binding sensor domain-containing protein